MRPSSAALLRHARVPSLLVSDPVNVGYLTGVFGDGLLALATAKRCVLFAHSLEFETAREHALPRVDVRPASALKAALGRVRRCGFEADHVTVARLARWKEAFRATSFVRTRDAVALFRRTKDDAERAAIARADSITERILKRMPRALVPGISERALAWKIEQWARAMGAEGMSFETIVAFGTHTSRPHHQPTDRALRKGDLVQIDMGVIVDRYLSDRSAVYFTGVPTPEQATVLAALEEAKSAAIAAVVPGIAASEPDRIARAVLAARGIAPKHVYDHSLGHGVGLEIHEGVSLSERSTDRLLEHEVVTVEPAVYVPGRFGMRLEDMCVVTG